MITSCNWRNICGIHDLALIEKVEQLGSVGSLYRLNKKKQPSIQTSPKQSNQHITVLRNLPILRPNLIASPGLRAQSASGQLRRPTRAQWSTRPKRPAHIGELSPASTRNHKEQRRRPQRATRLIQFLPMAMSL